MSAIVDFLETVPVFRGMSGLELNAVSAFLEPRRFKRGDTIFRSGDEGYEIFIVRTGFIASFVEQADGTRRDIYRFGPGRFFGEMAIIEGTTRSATCVAREDSELLVLDGLDFYRLVWEHPVIGVKLLSSMARVMVGWLAEASGFLNDMVRWGETARKRAVTDDLSGLFNRRFLEEALHLRFARPAEKPQPLSVLMLDLDRFRDINTKFGSVAGDAVIANASTAFSRVLRDCDIAARLSGDEFAVLLPGAGRETALKLADGIRREIEQLWLEFRVAPDRAPERLSVTVSVGAAVFPAHGTDPEALLKAADEALFKAKREGRNRVELA